MEETNLSPDQVTLNVQPAVQSGKTSSYSKKVFIIVTVLLLLLLLSFSVYTLVRSKSLTKPTPKSKVSSSVSVEPTSSISASLDLPPEINNSSVYYQKENIVYELSPLNSSPKVFLTMQGKGETYAISSNKKFIAYINGYGPDPSQDNSVHILNLENNTSKVIEADPQFPVNRGIEWSPKGTYILVDSGTGPEGGYDVYNLENLEKLSEFGDSKFLWLDEKTILQSKREKVEPPRPWGAGFGYSLVKKDITNGSTEVFLRADSKNDYRIIKLEKPCLYYSQTTVKSTDDWSLSEKEIESYYCLDLNTKVIKEVAYNEAESETSSIREKIEQIFPEYKNKILNIIQNPSNKNWAIINTNPGESIYKSNMLIIDLINPKESLRNLGQGTRIYWFSL